MESELTLSARELRLYDEFVGQFATKADVGRILEYAFAFHLKFAREGVSAGVAPMEVLFAMVDLAAQGGELDKRLPWTRELAKVMPIEGSSVRAMWAEYLQVRVLGLGPKLVLGSQRLKVLMREAQALSQRIGNREVIDEQALLMALCQHFEPGSAHGDELDELGFDVQAFSTFVQQRAQSASNWKQEEPETAPVSVGGEERFARDAGENELCLNVDDYAEAVGDLFANADDGEFCFALFAPWGRGKTFLMRRVEKKLSADENKYRIVRFSAWKYPTAPEVWVHLYEEFAKATFHVPWYRSIPTTLRVGMAKHGSVPLIWSLVLLAFSLVPLLDIFVFGKLLASLVYPLFGIMGFVWLYSLVRGIQATGARLGKDYLSATRHSEKLGLQATIGADLTALLKGWIRTPKFSNGFVIAYWISTACIVGATWLRLVGGDHRQGELPTLFGWEIQMSSHLGLAVGICIGILAIAMGAIAFMRFGGAGARRVLLVVDDLDRCKPEHLVSVVESIKLLMEDPEISKRVQAAMLLEETVLNYALLEKYSGLAAGDERAKERIVAENKEKLFTAHLRLPPLTAEEIGDLVEAFSGRRKEKRERLENLRKMLANITGVGPRKVAPKIEIGTKEGYEDSGKMVRGIPIPQRIREPVFRDATPEEIAAQREVIEKLNRDDEARVQLHQEEVRLIESRWGGGGMRGEDSTQKVPNRIFSDEEVDNILDALRDIPDLRANIGPRTVRSFLFRYQLARRLLQRLRATWQPEELAQLLANAFTKRSTPVSATRAFPKIHRVRPIDIVVSQVS